MTYKRITKEERILIYRWGKEHKSINEIGRLLKRAPSSISREISRNTGCKSYRSKQAHEKSREKAKRPGIRRFTEEIRIDVETRLKYGWTPDIICNRAKLEGRPYVCKETIYKYIYADAKKGTDRNLLLPA